MTWRDRLPLGLSIASLLLATLGLTPLGEAAARAVRVAFAERTDAVGGISASRTPQAGRLLALDGNGRFPASVVPGLPSAKGPAGPVGAAGPSGIAGTDGGRAITVREGPWPGEIAGDDVRAAVIEDIPAGPWVLMATAELGSTDPAGASQVYCAMRQGVTTLGTGAVTVGHGPGGTARATMGVIGALQGATPGDVEFFCRNLGGGDAVKLHSASLTALHVADIRVLETG